MFTQYKNKIILYVICMNLFMSARFFKVTQWILYGILHWLSNY